MDINSFFDTLARIISDREKAEVHIKANPKGEKKIC
jgi:hypothetical protein